mmetsp:Transcript_8546/g.9692  ORF Transcript_8546/g.9692 Transcript_8546/m.9692 type:complete len:141 (-) Transcript_8546:14-436(-)
MDKEETETIQIIDDSRGKIKHFQETSQEELKKLKEEVGFNAEYQKKILYRDNIQFRKHVNNSFLELKQDRHEKIDELKLILENFETKMYKDRETFETQAFDELHGTKSSLADEREYRIESDNKLLDKINLLVESLVKTDD